MTKKEHTIEIVGYPNSNIGISVQLRSLANALKHLGFNIVLRDCWETRLNISNNEQTDYLNYQDSSKQPDLRIFSSTPHEVTSLYLKSPSLFNAIPTIGHFAWEFQRLPRHLHIAKDLTDEIWSISNFVAESFIQPNKPVITIPNGIEHCRAAIKYKKGCKTRQKHSETFNILIAFDVNSSLFRKNPYGAIDALWMFQKMHGEAKFEVTIKLNNADENHEKTIKAKLGFCKNVKVINQRLSSDDTLNLIASADVFMSLHRTEGFGLVIAEAMALGTTVITTGFSGNMDFCTEENSYLVDYEEIIIQNEQYPHVDWAIGAEPSVMSAAEKLIEAYDNPKQRQQKLDQAKKDIWKKYDINTVSKSLYQSPIIKNFLTLQ